MIFLLFGILLWGLPLTGSKWICQSIEHLKLGLPDNHTRFTDSRWYRYDTASIDTMEGLKHSSLQLRANDHVIASDVAPLQMLPVHFTHVAEINTVRQLPERHTNIKGCRQGLQVRIGIIKTRKATRII